MKNFIDHINIENFKSIDFCRIENCKRINLFIGRPNVGKSNILEALSVFSIPFLRENTSKKLSDLIRVEHEAELFYRGKFEEGAHIEAGPYLCEINYSPKETLVFNIWHGQDGYHVKVDEKLRKRSKQVNTKNDDSFRRLFKALEKAQVSDILRLKEWVSYLKEHPYVADLNLLHNY